MKFSLATWIVSKVGNWLNKTIESPKKYLCDFDKISYEVRPGDVLLVEGRNRISRIIRRVTQSSWSHSALYIGRLHDIDDRDLRSEITRYYSGPLDSQLVIESHLGHGTIVRDIKVYEDDHIRICRPEGLARADAQHVIAYSVKRLGTKYHIRHVIDLARFLGISRLFPRRFGSVLFKQHPQALTHEICSSMIASAFTSVKFPILPLVKENENQGVTFTQRNPRLFTPRDFDYSPYFSIIKYPMFAVSSHTTYRKLPWEAGTHDDEE